MPLIITTAVVLSCLGILLLDWGFSQAYVRLDDTHIIATADPADLYADAGDGEHATAAVAAGDAAVAGGAMDVDEGAAQGYEAPMEMEEEDVDGDHDEL